MSPPSSSPPADTPIPILSPILADTVRQDTTAPAPGLHYKKVEIDSARNFTDLVRGLRPGQFDWLLKINRVDLKHVRTGEALIVPNDLSDPMALSPFPPRIERLRAVPKMVLVSQRVQAFAAYEAGLLVRWGPTSTGKRSTPTPTGLFFTNWKSKEAHSTDDSTWVLKWYSNFDNRRGVAFHLYELPGFPASHACARLMIDDAQWIYDWTNAWVLSKGGKEIVADGTPVLVLDEYHWDEPPPWRILPQDPHATDVTLEEIDRTLAGLLPEIYTRQEAEDLLNPRPNPDSVLAEPYVPTP